MNQPRLGDEGLERFEPPQQTNNYDINGLYLDPPNYQQAVQQDLLPTVVRHLTPPAGPAPVGPPAPAGPPAHPPPLAAAAAATAATAPPPPPPTAAAAAAGAGAAPEHETEKPGSATICGVRRKVFWVMTLVAVLLILISVGGGLAARFVMENKVKAENIGTATALTQTAASPVGGVPKTQTPLVNSQLITIAVTTDGTTSWETSVTTITVCSSPTATVFSTITTKTSDTGPTTLPPQTSSSGSGSDPCSDTLLFKSSVGWAGVSNTAVYPLQILWLFDLPSGGSCCSQCWSLAPQKCNVWGYFPLGHPVGDRVSCAIVYDYPGSQQDAMCPAGRPLVGILPGPTNAVGIAGNVGGTGPCAGPLYTQ